MDRRQSGLERRLHETRLALKNSRDLYRRSQAELARLRGSTAKRLDMFRAKMHLRQAELEQKIKRLSMLYQVGHAMASNVELDPLLAAIVRLAARHLKARKASIMLLDESGRTLRINASVGIRRWIVSRTEIRLGESIAGLVAAEGMPLLIRDIATDQRFQRPSRGTYLTGSFVAVPLGRRGKTLGVLNVSDKRTAEPFDADDLNLVLTLAAEASYAVENATLYKGLREQINSLEELNRVREKEQRRLLTLINSITDGVFAVDGAGHTIMINERAKDLLRAEAWPDGAMPQRQILPDDELGAAIGAGITDALNGSVARREADRDPRQGKAGSFDVISIPLREREGPLGALCLIRDITAIKELDRARGEFLNRASHQLKTPVGLIKGFAETLLRHQDLSEDKRANFLSLIHGESSRLGYLIENLLDFARIESGVMRVERELVSISEMMGKLLPAIEARAAEKGISLDVSLPRSELATTTDPDCLTEVLRNLLDNSLKFTPRGGRISVAIVPEEDGLRFTVADTGAGISEVALPHIFEKFFTGQAGTSQGTGLGLYIAKEMIDALGGRVNISSRQGEGTVVSIYLPATAPADGPQLFQSLPAGDPQRHGNHGEK